jgi:hypothetical protein
LIVPPPLDCTLPPTLALITLRDPPVTVTLPVAPPFASTQFWLGIGANVSIFVDGHAHSASDFGRILVDGKCRPPFKAR